MEYKIIIIAVIIIIVALVVWYIFQNIEKINNMFNPMEWIS